MNKILLSIDWDYFIKINQSWCGSFIENKHNLKYVWYKRYIQEKRKGNDIEKQVKVSKNIDKFWRSIFKNINIDEKVPVYVSDSHKFSYKIAKKYGCQEVCLFDAHSDLGYGGLNSLKFEVNCANWLGKLFYDGIINRAGIIYSPYTFERPKDFREINKKFYIDYSKDYMRRQKICVNAIHICRSGAWTPPWLDGKFYKFIDDLKKPYIQLEKMNRNWKLSEFTLADQINCLIS